MSYKPKWPILSLSSLVKINSGIALPKIFINIRKEGEIPFYKVGQMNNNQKFMINSPYYFSLTESKTHKIKIFPKGSVLIPKRGAAIYTNKKRILLEDASYDSNIMGLTPLDLITTEYLYNFLLSIDLGKYIDDAGIPQINNKHIEQIQIPLPPLATQQAIVAKLDEASALITTAKQAIQSQIDELEKLWQSSLSEVFEKYHIKKIKDVIIEPKKSEISDLSDDIEVSFVPMADMGINQIYCESKQSRKLGEVRKGYTYFSNNDILLAKVTPCFENGKSGIAKNLINKIGFGSSEYYVLRPLNNMLPEFLYHIISSQQFLIDGAKNMGGAVGLQRVKKEWLMNYSIPLPPLPEQQKIVTYLDQLHQNITSLKAQYQSQVEQYDKLWASILDQAFKGELVE